jgi:hypothetical protein
VTAEPVGATLQFVGALLELIGLVVGGRRIRRSLAGFEAWAEKDDHAIRRSSTMPGLWVEDVLLGALADRSSEIVDLLRELTAAPVVLLGLGLIMSMVGIVVGAV